MESKPIVKKILRSPNLKRKSKGIPISQRVTLEKVLGLTVSKNAGLACDANTGTIAYPAGCVIVLFNPRKNKQTHIFNSSKKTLTTVAFSGDGKHLVSGESGHQPAVRVWDVEERTQVAQFLGHKFGINCVVFSPNLKYIVSVGSQHDMMVNVWNWKTNSKVKSNKVSSKVNAVAFSEDGSYFVTVGNRHVKFWYLENLKSKVNETVPLLGRNGILEDQKNNFFCDVACGHGSTAGCTFCITQSGLLCELDSKRRLSKWVELRTTSANCISVGEDHIFIGCSGGIVRVFSSQSLRYVTTLPKPHALGVDIAAATTPSHMVSNRENAKFPDTIALVTDITNKKITCVYNDHSLYIWDVRDLNKVGKAWSFLFHSSCVWGIEPYPRLGDGHTPLVPPGSFITCSSDDTIRIWNLDQHMPENTTYKHNIYSHEVLKIIYVDPTFANLCDVNYNPAGNKDKTDTNYDGKNGVRAIKVSPDGQHLASGDRLGNIRVHHLQYMDEITTIEAHDGEVLSLEFSNFPSGPRLLSSTSRDRLVHVFDVEQDYGLIQTLDDHSSSISAVKFTETDHTLKMLSCGADKSLLFRNAVLSPSFQFSLSNHLVGKTTLYDMDIDPTHKFVATACQDRNIRIYNIKTAKQKKCYKGAVGDDGVLTKVRLDPSGSYIATSSTDKNLCILDFYSGELLATMFGHSEIATCVQFTNDHKHLISTGAEGCIFVWRLSSDFTKQMRSRLEELGRIPKDLPLSADNEKRESFIMPKPIVFDQTEVDDSFPVFRESEFKSPETALDSLGTIDEVPSRDIKSGPNVPSTPVGYRFSVGSLPKWAKPTTVDESSKNGEAPGVGQPRGKWAERVDSQAITVKSMLDGEKTIELATDSSNERRYTYEADVLRRETMVVSKTQYPSLNLPIITADDENNIEDDDDFLPLSFGLRNLDRFDCDRSLNMSCGSDPSNLSHKWTSRRSLLVDGDDADDEETDSDTREVIYYPQTDADISDANSNSYKVFAISSDELKEGRTKLRRSNVGSDGSIRDGDSESTDPLSLEDVEEESDDVSSLPTTPLEPERDFTPTKSRFIQENIENFTPIAKDKFFNNLDILERKLFDDEASKVLSPRLSISAKFLNRAGGLGRNVARQDTWFDSVQKRKDDMARAVDETRRKLESLGWGGERADQSHLDHPPERGAKLSIPPPDTYYSLPRLKKTQFNAESTKESSISDQKRSTPNSPSRSVSLGKSDAGDKSCGYKRNSKAPSIRRSWSTADLFKPIKETISSNYKDSSLKDSAKYGKPPLPKGRNSRIPFLRNLPIGCKTKATGALPNKLRVSTFELRPKSISEEPVKPPKPATLPKTTMLDKNDSPSYMSKRSVSSKSIPSEVAEETMEKPRLYTRRHSSEQQQQHSYLRPTKSSRAKIARAASSSSLNRDKSHDVSSSMNSSSMEDLSFNDENTPIANFDNFRHSLSRQMTVSVPNLATCFEEEDEEEEPTNLYDLADLSKSVPDFMDADDTSSNYSDNSSLAVSEPAVIALSRSGHSARAMRDSSRKVNQWNTRRSLPGDIAGSKPSWARHTRSRDDFDRLAMPPPSKTQVARTGFLRKAAQAKRRSAPDLTLEQAKNILLGNSGILGKSAVQDFQRSKSNTTKSRQKDSNTVTEYPESGKVSNLKQQFSKSNAKSSTSSSNSSSLKTSTFNLSDHQGASGDKSLASLLDASPIEPPVRDQPSKPPPSHKPQSIAAPGVKSPGPSWISPPTKEKSASSSDLVNGGISSGSKRTSRLPGLGKSPSSGNVPQGQPVKMNSTKPSRLRPIDLDIQRPEKDSSNLSDITADLSPTSLSSGDTNSNSPRELNFPKQSTSLPANPHPFGDQQAKTSTPKLVGSVGVSSAPSAGILRKAMMFGQTREVSPTTNTKQLRGTAADKIIDDSCSEFDEISALTITPSKLRSSKGGVVLPWQTNGKPQQPQSDSGVSSDTDESEPKRPARRLPVSTMANNKSNTQVSTLKPELSSKPKMSLPTVPPTNTAHMTNGQRRSSAPSQVLAATQNSHSAGISANATPSLAVQRAAESPVQRSSSKSPAVNKPDKSQLKLPVHSSGVSLSKKPEKPGTDVKDCDQAILEMKKAFRRVKHLYEQFADKKDTESRKMADSLSTSLNDIQRALIEMSAESTNITTTSFKPITPTPDDDVRMSGALTPTGQADNAAYNINMIQPILEHYSEKIFSLIQRRLDSSTPSSSSDA